MLTLSKSETLPSFSSDTNVVAPQSPMLARMARGSLLLRPALMSSFSLASVKIRPIGSIAPFLVTWIGSSRATML